MTILCAGHADDVQAGSDYQDAPCRPSALWRGGRGQAVLCDVIANPVAVATYVNHLPGCAFCPAGNHHLCEKRHPIAVHERALVAAVFGVGATACCCQGPEEARSAVHAGAHDATTAWSGSPQSSPQKGT